MRLNFSMVAALLLSMALPMSCSPMEVAAGQTPEARATREERLSFAGRLPAGESLQVGDSVVSGNTSLIFQGDGNLVLYRGDQALWATMQFGPPSTFAMQTDCNAVAYSTEGVLWHAGTNGQGTNCSVQVVADDWMVCSGTQTLFRARGIGSCTTSTPTAGYQGCFTDDPARALPSAQGDGFDNNSCRSRCAGLGFAYAGTQYYGQCFCGNTLGYQRTSDDQCDTPCSVNGSQMCGGAWRNSIYASGAPQMPPYTRPPVGAPVPPGELAAITDLYRDLLAQTNYFNAVDERVLGWPESDPEGRYWYGHWWTGAGFNKTQGQVSLVHGNTGADNAGIGTSLVLEGMCAAQQLWPAPVRERLVRRLVRGLNAWRLAGQRFANDPQGPILVRTSYPPSVTSNDFGRTVFIDYSASRPGVDNYTQYVHLPNNPHWPDLFIKNNRSKDDIGHMLRAIGSLEDCAGSLSADTLADIAEMRAGYMGWAQRVENDGWTIATLEKNGNPRVPPTSETMSHYILTGNAECTNAMALRLFGRGSPGGFSCGDGIHPLEFLVLRNPSNGEILRSHHVAATKHALVSRNWSVARSLLDGLVRRIESGMDAAESGDWPGHIDEERLTKLLIFSAGAGVPLTSREVRWLHGVIARAHQVYASGPRDVYRIFDPSTPDGAYEFTPSPSGGLDFRFLAAMISTCTSARRNPSSAPLFDCERLAAAGAPQ